MISGWVDGTWPPQGPTPVLWNGWTSPGRLRDPFPGEAHPRMYLCTCVPVLRGGCATTSVLHNTGTLVRWSPGIPAPSNTGCRGTSGPVYQCTSVQGVPREGLPAYDCQCTSVPVYQGTSMRKPPPPTKTGVLIFAVPTLETDTMADMLDGLLLQAEDNHPPTHHQQPVQPVDGSKPPSVLLGPAPS